MRIVIRVDWFWNWFRNLLSHRLIMKSLRSSSASALNGLWCLDDLGHNLLAGLSLNLGLWSLYSWDICTATTGNTNSAIGIRTNPWFPHVHMIICWNVPCERASDNTIVKTSSAVRIWANPRFPHRQLLLMESCLLCNAKGTVGIWAFPSGGLDNSAFGNTDCTIWVWALPGLGDLWVDDLSHNRGLDILGYTNSAIGVWANPRFLDNWDGDRYRLFINTDITIGIWANPWFPEFNKWQRTSCTQSFLSAFSVKNVVASASLFHQAESIWAAWNSWLDKFSDEVDPSSGVLLGSFCEICFEVVIIWNTKVGGFEKNQTNRFGIVLVLFQSPGRQLGLVMKDVLPWGDLPNLTNTINIFGLQLSVWYLQSLKESQCSDDVVSQLPELFLSVECSWSLSEFALSSEILIKRLKNHQALCAFTILNLVHAVGLSFRGVGELQEVEWVE